VVAEFLRRVLPRCAKAGRTRTLEQQEARAFPKGVTDRAPF
jgi:hypothetical protein